RCLMATRHFGRASWAYAAYSFNRDVSSPRGGTLALPARGTEIMSEKKQTPGRQEDEPIQFGDELPVLPIRNAVLFPGAVAPFDVGREKSVALVEDVDYLSAPVIAIFAQRDPSTDDPG